MTTLSLSYPLPPDQTSVTLTATQFGYSAEWAKQPIGQAIEIWQNTTNNRSTSTKVGTVYDTYFDSDPLTVGQPYYVWTRRLSNLGTPGNWDYGETAGQVVTPTGATINDLGASSSSSSGALSFIAGSSVTPSTYGTWATVNIRTFTILAKNALLCINKLSLGMTYTAASGGNAYDDIQMRAKIEFYDNTTSALINNYFYEFPLIEYFKNGTTWEAYGQTNVIHSPMIISTGFGSQFIPGHSITMKLSVIKERIAGTTATAAVTVKYDVSATSSYFS